MEIKVKIESNANELKRAAEKANDWSLRRAGAYIMGVARKGIKTSKVAARPGAYPHTRKGRLRKSIIFAVEEKGVNVLIGPSAGIVGKIGATHEFGGTEAPKKVPEGTIDATGRPIKVPGTNWRLGPQGWGPIVDLGLKTFRYGKLRTMKQVRLAQKIAEENFGVAIGSRRKPRTYPKRAFMAPTLNAALQERIRIPSFWYASIRG